jgi:hypothetical protein
VFGRGGNGDPFPPFLQTHNAFQRPFFPSLFLHIPYSIQKLLPMTVGKSAAELDDSTNLAIPDLQARGA